jgi:Tol biopolymer transport system component
MSGWRSTRSVLALLAGPLLLSLLASPASAAPALRAGDLVFARVVPAGFDLELVHADGTGARLLTHVGDARDPAWSPDGRTLAYSAGGDIWLLTPGVGSHRLTHDGRSQEPAWSADGRRVSFSRVVQGVQRDVFEVPVAGGAARRLSWAAATGCTAQQPAWHGTTLAYVRTRPGTGTCTEGLVVRPAGGPARVVVADPSVRHPVFTSAGRALLFVAPCDPSRCSNEGGWKVGIDGSDLHMVLDQYRCVEGDLCLASVAAAPGGGWVALTTFVDQVDPSIFEVCFQGGVEDSTGTVVPRPPAFCLDMLGTGLTVRP